jgi:hypothetical protein
MENPVSMLCWWIELLHAGRGTDTSWQSCDTGLTILHRLEDWQQYCVFILKDLGQYCVCILKDLGQYCVCIWKDLGQYCVCILKDLGQYYVCILKDLGQYYVNVECFIKCTALLWRATGLDAKTITSNSEFRSESEKQSKHFCFRIQVFLFPLDGTKELSFSCRWGM